MFVSGCRALAAKYGGLSLAAKTGGLSLAAKPGSHQAALFRAKKVSL